MEQLVLSHTGMHRGDRSSPRPRQRVPAISRKLRTRDLQKALQDSGIESIRTASAWLYDSPWAVPFLRRNEIAMPVDGIGNRPMN
jgi:hypothetical protein